MEVRRMRVELSQTEEAFVDELLAWDDSRRSSDWLLCNVALAAGGCVIAATAAFTVFNLTDEFITGLTVPGFLTGLFLIGAYAVGGKRVRDRHRLATIMRKMKGAA
jgi:ABC-type uncharacterized transport system permease subunit